VGALPHRSDTNPYVGLLYGSMRRHGWRVVYPSFRTLWLDRPGILHLHWPEDAIGRVSLWRNRANLARLVARVTLAKILGAKIVWTVHNLEPHECIASRRATAAFYRWLAAMVDGCIYLTDASRREVWRRRPRLGRVPCAVIPHGHYRPMLPNLRDRNAIRSDLNVAAGNRLIVSFGMIRPYKRTDALMAAFSQLPASDLRLLVTGQVEDAGLARQLSQLAARDPRIAFRPGFLSEEQLAETVTAADLVVLPFQNVLNSGSVLYALSLGRRVLTSRRGSMPELAAEFPDWVRLCDEITPAALAAALADPPPAGDRPAMDRYEWDAIASRTAQFFEDLVQARSPRVFRARPGLSRTAR
jgi:glycosyltransferase involved in cell wall biosynthesis